MGKQLPPSEEARLRKDQRSLLLAASDMTQAIAAARMLQATQDVAQARALETAMAVCFMRPYTKSDLAVPDLMFPTEESADPGDRELFELLKAFRDKVFAHSDKEGGRQAGPVTIDAGPEIVNLSWTEALVPLSTGPPA